jgi:hypothetical protein
MPDHATTKDVVTAAAALNGWSVRHSPSVSRTYSDYMKGDGYMRVYWDSMGRMLRASVAVPGFSNVLDHRISDKRRQVLQVLQNFPG